MNKIEIYSCPYITVGYYPDHQLIYHTVHQPMGLDQMDIYKEALTLGGDALVKYGLSKWLSDDRKNGPVPIELLEWGNQEWNPRLLANGWKYWANVVPESLHAAGSLIPIIDAFYERGLRMMVFTQVEDALAWLDDLE